MTMADEDDYFKAEATYSGDEVDRDEDFELFSIVEVITAIQKVLDSQDLFYRQIDKWLLITRKGFDCFINDEPHHAITFLLDLDTGQYLIRVWSKTLLTGFIQNPECIHDKILDTFQGNAPCTGVLQEEQAISESVLFNEFPFSRMISTKCSYVTKVDHDLLVVDKQLLCKPCTVMSVQNPEEEEDRTEFNPFETSYQFKAEPGLVSNDDDNSEDDEAGSAVVKEEEEEEQENEEDWNDVDMAVEDSLSNYGDSEDEKPLKKRPKQKLVKKRSPKKKGSNKFMMPCDSCSESFTSLALLRNHQKTVHLVGSYTCSACEEKFGVCSEYLSHVESQHPETDKLSCTTCREELQLAKFEDHLR